MSDTTKTLTDADIHTVQRRPGPSAAPAGTDVDHDAHAATDHDTHVATDSDAAPAPSPHKDAD